MARIDIKTSVASAYGDGQLQLQNKAPMDGTLRIVTDSANTASPLKLSTALVQSTSTVKITTSDVAYIDAEDNSGNNRFTVSRAVASQLVTVDFASVPSSLTTPVGAIRTATDGVNLANVMTFLENGKIGLSTDTPNSKLEIVGNSCLTMRNSATDGFAFAQSNTNSWAFSALSGGSILAIQNSSLGIGTTTPTALLQVKGSGTTSATTSLLVQNSAGSTLFSVKDNAAILLNGTVAINSTNGDFGGFLQTTATENVTLVSSSYGTGSSVNVNTNGVVIQRSATNSSSAASAVLDVRSTTQGFLPPRMTTAQKNAIASPAAGLMVYDSTLNKLCVYTTAWETITSV